MKSSENRISVFYVIGSLIKIRIKALGFGFIVIALCSVGRGLIWGFGILTMQVLFDAVETTLKKPEIGYSLIINAVLRMIFVILSEQILNSGYNYLRQTQTLLIKRDLLDKINKKAMNVDPILYEDTRRLEDIEKAVNGVDKSIYLIDSFLEVFTYFAPFLGYVCYYLFTLRPLLLVVFFLILVPAAVNQMIRSKLIWKMENKSSPIRREYEHYEAAMCNREYLKETRQLGAFGFFFHKYKKTLSLLNEAVWKYEGKSRYYELVMQIVTVTGYAGILVLLAFSLKDGFITVGAFGAVLASIERLFDSVYGMINWGFFADLSEYLPYARNLINFYSLPERNGKDIKLNTRNIKLSNVSFQYPGRANYAVDNVSLEIKNNDTIALVGENGSGKSTLIKLLTGLYLPTSGVCKVDGIDMRDLSLQSIFDDTTGVFQNYQKYKMTLENNIIISEMDRLPDAEKINQTTNEASLSFEADSFPNGLETMLSREYDGVDLSGGQWQRVAIARGLYRNHNMIVLDEPTAAIDPIEETALYKEFMTLSQGKTAVMVTHRLGSAKIANRIIVMDNGKIVEEGSHESLMKLNGKYAEMYNAQAQWYDEASVG